MALCSLIAAPPPPPPPPAFSFGKRPPTLVCKDESVPKRSLERDHFKVDNQRWEEVLSKRFSGEAVQ